MMMIWIMEIIVHGIMIVGSMEIIPYRMILGFVEIIVGKMVVGIMEITVGEITVGEIIVGEITVWVGDVYRLGLILYRFLLLIFIT